MMRRSLLALAGVTAMARYATADDAQVVQVGYLRWVEKRPTISLIDAASPDAGLAGAKLGIDDNNTTGRFTGQSFVLTDVQLRADDDPAAAAKDLAGRGIKLILSDLPADKLLAAADAVRTQNAVIFNAAAPEDALRMADCRANVIHVAPSNAMLADAVAQYLVWKKWIRWLLVLGSHPDDELLASAYRRAAKRFGAKIVQERVYRDTGESRQTDSGIVQTQQQVPVFMQNAPEHDVVVAADQNEVFANYLPYRTWDARPVAGSAGLEPLSWDPASENWGGTQLQNRFIRLFHRPVRALDMQAWTAIRMIGEAASRSQSADPAAIIGFIKGPDFGVAAYKGQRLTLRDWDLQLRQPILLSDGRTVVSVSPQQGFLHQVTELDTLGYDRPETTCKLH